MQQPATVDVPEYGVAFGRGVASGAHTQKNAKYISERNFADAVLLVAT